MIALNSVSKPQPVMEAMDAREAMVAPPPMLEGTPGSLTAEPSRSLKLLVGTGKRGPLISPLESWIGSDDRVRILDTELYPWRMLCALRMRGPSGAGAIGTGWLVGPKTVITAGHCVYSTHFFNGWASTIEVIPGLNGRGTGSRPFGSVHSTRFSSVDRWTQHEEADFDIGCIHLDDPIGDQVGWFSVAALSPEELESYLVNVSGYPSDRGGGMEQYHHRNRVLRVTERRLFYEVDTYGGQSGAPVWIHETEGAPPIVVGIHAYGIGGTPDNLGITANSAPRIIPEVLDTIAEWIDKDRGQPEA